MLLVVLQTSRHRVLLLLVHPELQLPVHLLVIHVPGAVYCAGRNAVHPIHHRLDAHRPGRDHVRGVVVPHARVIPSLGKGKGKVVGGV